VIGTAHHDGKAVVRRIFSEVFVGDLSVLLQPVFRCEPFEGGGEVPIDLSPCFLNMKSTLEATSLKPAITCGCG